MYTFFKKTCLEIKKQIINLTKIDIRSYSYTTNSFNFSKILNYNDKFVRAIT